jgi:hypothetical protein
VCPIGIRHEPAGGVKARWQPDPPLPQGFCPSESGCVHARGGIRPEDAVDILRRILHFGNFPSFLSLARDRLSCWPKTPIEPWEGSSPMSETVSRLPELPDAEFDATGALDGLLADVGLSAADAGGG